MRREVSRRQKELVSDSVRAIGYRRVIRFGVSIIKDSNIFTYFALLDFISDASKSLVLFI